MWETTRDELNTVRAEINEINYKKDSSQTDMEKIPDRNSESITEAGEKPKSGGKKSKVSHIAPSGKISKVKVRLYFLHRPCRSTAQAMSQKLSEAKDLIIRVDKPLSDKDKTDPLITQRAKQPESLPPLHSDTISMLFANQDRILHQLQNISDARDSKTLVMVINQIGMKKVAIQVCDLTNIWPVIAQKLRIRYDFWFKIKNAILNLKWFVHNIKKNTENPWFAKISELTQNLTFSILTPRRFQLQ